MKVLFAVSNENISNSIIKKYQQMYKEIISSKNVYYFNAILKELQKDKSYDRVIISEDLEPFTNNNFDTIDNFIFDKMDSISDEASNNSGEDIPIILIATDRRTKSDSLLVKLFGIGVYSTLIGQDRSIEEVCKLINKPRTKKEAKIYYQLDSNEVSSGYTATNESDVSEVEIQNILNHYKRLGRNEDRYVESFNSIASQYTDSQLKVIIKFLPLNVKAVLEENCPRYQQLTAFSGISKKSQNTYEPPSMKNRKPQTNSGIKVESILEKTGEKKLAKPVVIPSTVSTKNVKKVQKVNRQEDIELDAIDKVEKVKEEVNAEEPKKRRGRPRKIKPEEVEEVVKIEEQPLEIQSEEPQKKKRGRPKKVQVEEVKEEPVNLYDLDLEDEEEETMLPGLDEIDFEEESNSILDEEIEEQDETVDFLPGFDEDDDEIDSVAEEDEDYEYDEYEENDEEQYDEENDEEYEKESFSTDVQNPVSEANELNQIGVNTQRKQENEQPRRKSAYDELISNPVSAIATSSENLLTKDKKIVSFVGTSKNGTSFLVNNLAESLSSQGIRTAILDLTKNKNAYYIYTKNEEELRKVAFECMGKLTQGIAEGVKVNKSLDVYTCLPGEENYEGQSESIIQTLLKNYSLVLIDCDFETEYEYLRKSQEIYLVQSMDVLTIQPLTAYLRDLKAKGILEQEKLRAVINKNMRVRSVTERAIIGGMAFYNDPAMSFMTELFNRETIKYVAIPFDVQVYAKYLEGLVNCSITLNGYSKEFLVALKKLEAMVYPLINSKGKNNYNSYNNFSSDMNNTLDKMKGVY